MNIQWHLLAEQLMQHPEQVEEELQSDVMVLAGQAEQGRQQAQAPELPQEQDVLQRLRSQLGNFALQQLLDTDHNVASPTRAPERKTAGDPARRAALLLRQILIGLPDMPVAMLTELAILVEQRPALMADTLDTLEGRINTLTPAARKALMSLISRLPRSLTSGALMAALLVRLLATAPPAPAPEAAPAPPEE